MAVQLYCKAVADPDPQIRGGGGGGVIQTLRLVWGDWGLSQKKIFFQPFGPQSGLKIKGCPGPPVPSPGFATSVKGTCALKIKQWDF